MRLRPDTPLAGRTAREIRPIMRQFRDGSFTAGRLAEDLEFTDTDAAEAEWTHEPRDEAARHPDRTEAAFAGPYQADPGVVRLPDGQVEADGGRGMWSFDPEKRLTTWTLTDVDSS